MIMGLTSKILGPVDEILLSDFYNNPSTDSMINFYLNRDPSFFEALQVEGEDPQVFAVIDDETGQIAGSYIRSMKECYINGIPENVAYLGSMKIHPDFRGGWVFYKMVKSMQLRAKTDPRLHFFSIMSDNTNAGNLFLSGRPMLPVVRQAGEFSTRVFKPFQKRIKSSYPIVTARETGTDAIVSFLNTQGSGKQFFPVYKKEHFEDTSTGWLKGLNPENIFVALKEGRPAGTLALWNQGDFRRWMLFRSPKFRVVQPLINLYSLIRGLPTIPSGNKPVGCRYLSLICIQQDDPEIFESLLYYAMNHAHSVDRQPLFVLGHFDHDFMYTSLKFPSLVLKSKIFSFAWNENIPFLNSLDFKNSYIETGAL
jgi:hypothetical protein